MTRAMWSTALAVALCSAPQVCASEAKEDTRTFEHIGGTADVPAEGSRRPEPIAKHQGSSDANPVVEPWFRRPSAGSGLQLPSSASTPADRSIPRPPPRRLATEGVDPNLLSARNPAALASNQLAQFELPKPPREGEPAAPPLRRELPLEYAFGTDSEIVRRKNDDLNNNVRDNILTLAPGIFGWVTYRPTDWLEMRLEGTLEYIIAPGEQKRTLLPSGDLLFAEHHYLSLLTDQAYVTIKNITAPFEFTVGRRNFEDPRLWLYDVALDGFIVRHRQWDFVTEASVSRENLFDGDLFAPVPRGRINNYMLYSEYRGIEDHRPAAYVISRQDNEGLEGRPLFFGARSTGRPSNELNYWADLGFNRGKDELSRNLSGYAYDVGLTYRFPALPWAPNFTVGYAYGSGEGNPADNKTEAFRQTGLQSNEGRFGGVTQFKTYGETLDPELSNLKIFTFGVGFRPAATAFVDLVYHRYHLDKIGASGSTAPLDQLRGSPITALLNQVPGLESKDVGSEIDIVVGFRNLFGIRRLGFEIRAGWFYPGSAFITEDNGILIYPDRASSILAVFIY
jgi:alginate production protein